MKSIIVSMVAAAGLMVAGSAMSAEMPELAKKYACVACHAIDNSKKLPGPSFEDIAKKYKGVAGAKATLATKVIKGGGGVWKMALPMMPPNPKVTQADAETLVDFALSLAK